MASLKNSVAELGALSVVVRHVADLAETAGAPKMDVARSSLDAACGWLHGDKVTKKALKAAQDSCFEIYQSYWSKTGAERHTYFVLDAIGRLCASCLDGQDRVDLTLQSASSVFEG